MDELALYRLRAVESYSLLEIEQLFAMGTRLRRDSRLKCSAYMVGEEICRRLNSPAPDGFAFVSDELLAECLHLSVRTVKNAVKALRELGYFEVIKIGRSNRFEVRRSLIGPKERR